MLDNPLRLSPIQLDALREVGNIGAGNAATALSTLLGRRIDMTVPAVSVLPIPAVAELLGGDEAIVVGVYFRINGDAPGNMLFVLDEPSAGQLVDVLMDNNSLKAPIVGASDGLTMSALMEIGNILGSSYLSSLMTMTNLALRISVPALARDMSQAVLNIGLIQYGQAGDSALVIETAFHEGKSVVRSHFFFIPDPDSFGLILSSLGVPADE
ncbi:MAG: chemotaxis protein CheC [Bacillota bacterium]